MSKQEFLTKDQAMKKCLEEVGNPLVSQVLVGKYLLCNEQQQYIEYSPKQMWNRLAIANAKAETKDQDKHAESFRNLLTDWKFVPAGRILYGLGNPFVNVTLKNCYIMSIQEDSMKGIFDCGYWAAETYKSGGGVGLNISALRPKGSIVKNAARVSSGATNFMDFYSTITGMIGQLGRIGALLLSIDVSHPDVEDFITIKGGENLDLVRYANVSVNISDEFMRAVDSDSNFDLRWGGKVYRTVRARDLWNKIIFYAHKRAEPGLLFWDAVIRGCPSSMYDRLRPVCTNPCLTGNMRLLTKSGYKTMHDLWIEGGRQEYNGNPTIKKHGLLEVVNSNGVVQATNVYRTSECSDIFRVTLENGVNIDATANHKFIVINDSGNEVRKELKQLKVGDRLPINQQQVFGANHSPEYAELAGWVIGDGAIAEENENSMRAHITCYNEDIKDVLPRLRNDLKWVYSERGLTTNTQSYNGHEQKPNGFNFTKRTIKSQVLGRMMKEDGLFPGNKHHVPKSVWQGDKETVAAFLRGLFSADGSVQTNDVKKCISIRNMQVNKELLDECQLLLNQFGITSNILFRREASKKLMNDGKGGMKLYNKKAEYELIISGRTNVEKFINEIGFIQDKKMMHGKTWLSKHKGSNNSKVKTYSKVRFIVPIGQQETFCLTEPENHEISVQCIHIGNCGELPAGHGDSCNLGSVNFGKYVRNPWENNCSFDFESLARDTRVAVRFLDNIITMEKSPLEFQQWANDNGRRIGLGFMGLADTFMKMKVKFDTQQALDLADSIMKVFNNSAYDASCDLAIEKGAFPEFDAKKHMKSEFINRLPGQIKDKIKKTGIRNVAVLSVAPTGSISTIAECSSGVEPAFMIHYIRKTNLGTSKEVKEHEVWHKTAKEYSDKFNCKPENLPEFFVGALQVDNHMRIKLQAIVQKYVDQAISNTYNLDKNISTEEISKLYFDAWKNGLKGITVYRDGSRENVLESVNAKEVKPVNEIVIHNAPRRPDSLDAKVHLIKPNGKTFIIFIGMLNGRVYEVFALDHKLAGLTDGMTGKIVREKVNGKNIYHFENGPLLVRKLNSNEDDEASLVTRLVSTALRHGTPLEFIIDQISKSKTTITSFAKAIAKALSYYIRQEDVKGKFKCSKCGSDDIHFEGMCQTCRSCGHSKCG